MEWDDRMATVRWVNVSQAPVSTSSSRPSSATSTREQLLPLQLHQPYSLLPDKQTTLPAKQKVIEKEPEPEFKTVGEATDLTVYVSAVASYAEYECSTKSIRFKDTYMFQTRAYR